MRASLAFGETVLKRWWPVRLQFIHMVSKPRLSAAVPADDSLKTHPLARLVVLTNRHWLPLA